MREAMIICPLADNTGKLRPKVWLAIRNRLIDAFGGVTVRNAEGYWRNDDGKLYLEHVKEFTVACEDNTATNNQLMDIAERIGFDLKQHAVYIRFPSGDVSIFDTHLLWQLPQAAE